MVAGSGSTLDKRSKGLSRAHTVDRVTVRHVVRRLDTPSGLIGMVLVAVVVRLLVAPHFGFYGDIRYFREWSERLADRGLGNFYEPGYFSDYPPGFLYVLALIGRLPGVPGYVLLKVPTIVGDLALAWVCALLAERLAPESLRHRLAVRPIVMLAVLFNPAVLGVGALWGQVDSFPAAFVMGALLMLLTGRHTVTRDLSGMLLFAAAIAMKPQSGFLAPVLAYLLVRRYLIEARPVDRPAGVLRLLGAGLPSVVLWGISGLPFGLNAKELIDFYRSSADVYPVTSANAFNFWGLAGFFKPDSNLPYGTDTDTVRVLGMSAQRFGVIIVVLGALAMLLLAHRAIQRGAHAGRTLLATAVATNLLAYTMLTRMHERYMFPVIACLAPLVLWRGFRAAYWTLSALYVINLWYPFALYNGQWDASGQVGRVRGLQWQPVFGWFFGDINSFDTDQKKFWSVLVVIAMLVFLAQYLNWVERPRLVDEPRSGDRRPASPPRASVAAPTANTESAPTAGTQTGAAHAPADVAPSTPRAEPGSTPLAPPSPIEARIHRLRERTRIPTDTEPAVPWFRQYGPAGIVTVACLFGIAALRSETRSARTLNDSTFHLQMIRWAERQFERGRIPFDGWFPDLTLGSSFFHHYQSLPYTITAALSRVLHMSTTSTYLWITYLLIALWPISVYVGGRLLGWGKWAAACAAAVSPLIISIPSYGYEHSSYTFQGWGVYTQLWGMWMLPLTWGLVSRAVRRGRGYPLAAAAFALTIATHLMTGYLAVLCLPALGLLTAHAIWQRVGRLVLVAAGGLLTASWVLVPLLADADVSAQSIFYKGTLYNDSYGADKIMGWLLGGDLLDGRHLPVITVFAAIGFVVCAIRIHEERSRVLLGLWTTSLVVYFGRVTWGSVIDILPGSEDLQMHRFLMGVQLASILMAGIGIATTASGACRVIRPRLARIADLAPEGPFARRPHLLPVATWAMTGVVLLAVLSPAWRQVWRYDTGGEDFINQQRLYDATDGRDVDALLSIVNERADGRVYAGTRANWGASYKVGFVPVLHFISHNDADGVGFTFRTVQSLTTDIEASFDETNPAQYEMLNIKYILSPNDRQPPVQATRIAGSGRHVLYEVRTTGYFQVADRIGVIAANRKNINAATEGFRNSRDALQNLYPAVAFNGDDVPAPTATMRPDPEPGRVIAQGHERDNGIFTATVEATRRATVVLKATYDPRWRVTVDGRRADIVMIAPSLVGVDVDPGTHEIRFSYQSYPHYPWLFLLAALALTVLGLWPQRQRWLRAASRRVHGIRSRLGDRDTVENGAESTNTGRAAPADR